MDQHLTMKHLASLPLVQSLRSEDLSYKNISNSIYQLIQVMKQEQIILEMKTEFSRWNSLKIFVHEAESFAQIVDTSKGTSQVETTKNSEIVHID
jgi:hypothetical protein